MTKTSDPTVLETAKDRATDMANDAADAATEKAKHEATKARDMAANEKQKAANAAEAAAREFDPGSVQAHAIEHVASRIDEIADHLRTTDVDRLARTVGDAARRNPIMFVAGAALAGFAVTRFLKARDPQRNYAPSYGDDPWANPTRSYAGETGPSTPNLTSRGSY
ncbi:MAG: hypothetical protein AAFQ39_11395 [Pseudomonadota bacterium]